MSNETARFAELLIEAMAEGVFTLDKAGRINLWNRAMERISGYPASAVMGKTCHVLGFDRCLQRQCPKGVRDCGIYVHGAVDGKECSLRHRDGHEVPVLKNARVVRDASGTVVGVVETLTDLTALKRAERQVREATQRLEQMHGFAHIIGKSPAMQAVYAAIRAAAASEASVLIEGESGTGKELVAGAIHFHSARGNSPMITVNCSALPESLLESELFGHVAGAFTGALRPRIGRFEEAEGGTVFLDEIGDIPPAVQVKLLRVLQQREIQRVGESKLRPVDIRVIAATHRDLRREVQLGRFREDLYYRIKVFPIRVPALRQRREDLPLLSAHFIEKLSQRTGKPIAAVSPAASRTLLRCSWPGNVRELENAIEHAFVLASGPTIELADLPLEIQSPLVSLQPQWEPQTGKLGHTAITRLQLLAHLQACGWNKAEVARQVGLSRTAIWKYMKRYGIPLSAPTDPSGDVDRVWP